MRRPDWQEVLFRVCREWKNELFGYGTNDCCLFAARCVDAITGSDWVSELGAHYWDKRSALSYISDIGGIGAGATARLGPPVSRLNARRGDVCLVEADTGYSLSVCVGDRVIGPGIDGQYSRPLSDVICAWRID